MKAVVLLSGGLDSSVTLAKAIHDGNEAIALSFRYGQRHTKELDSARAVCEHYKIKHIIMDIDLSIFRSSLTDTSMNIPERDHGDIGSDIPDTYVPARNIIMMSIAAGLCESVDAGSIYIGVNTVDYSGYPDCRPEFIEQFQNMLSVGTRAGVEGNPIRIMTPILNMSKKEIVQLGTELNAPLGKTWSCYNGSEKACGRCDSCKLRRKGFADAGIKDETEYERTECE